jgi:hypothetical protein
LITTMVKALLLLLVPAALFMAGGVLMMRATGRARFRQRRKEPASRPLNFRFRGYDATAASEYWRWLGSDGLAAELRFLKADMLFPLWYGGAMMGSLYVGWLLLGPPVSLFVLALPVLIAMAADWVENVIHIKQIARFRTGRSVTAQHIRVASMATSTKLLFFWLSTLLIVVLAVGVGYAQSSYLRLEAT